GVAQDHESPGAHAGARLEPVLGGPGLEQRFLHEVVGHVGPAAETAREGPQVWHDLGELALEGAFVVGAALGQDPFFLAHLSPSSSLESKSLNVSGMGSSITES